MMANAELITEQKEILERITKLCKNTKKASKTRLTVGYLEISQDTLEEYWNTFRINHQATRSIPSETLTTLNFNPSDTYDKAEESYIELKAFIKDSFRELHGKSSKPPETSTPSDVSTICRAKLPPIGLPRFSGDYNEWMSYRDLFLSLVHNNDTIPAVEKHHHLKASLHGEAEQLLKHFATTEANYPKAWRTLEDRYNNKRMIVNHILNRLLNQKKLNGENAKGVKELLDTTQECLNSLENLKIDVSSWDAIIIHIVVGKLDLESHKLWEQSLTGTELPTFHDLAKHLESRFRTMEMIQPTQRKDITNNPRNSNHSNNTKPIHVKTFVAEVDTSCTYCSQNHYICHCKDFAQLEIPKRQEFVKANGICFNCLVKGHSVFRCRQSTYCKKCGKRHHTLLHGQARINPVTESQPETSTPVTLKVEKENTQVLLATARLAVKASNGSTHMLRALIDQGSQASFLTEAAAQLLNLERIPVEGTITGISSNTSVSIKYMVDVTFYSMRDRTHLKPHNVQAYVLQKLTSLLPSQEFFHDPWPQNEDIELADPLFYKPGSVDILLGADVHAHIIQEGLRRHNSLIALNSSLGWLISGKVTNSNLSPRNIVVAHMKMELDELIRGFWEIEQNCPNTKSLTNEEIQCEEHFKNTHMRQTDGRYTVDLPFKDVHNKNIGDTKQIALNRLLQMERRFKHKPEFHEEYCKFMKQYLSQGHMEPVPEKERELVNTYYLPHHAVVRLFSTSTKLRVVFDGSAKPEKGNSLNDELLTGPPLQQDICDLITRWRQHKICFIADIQQMYRQILVSKKDVDYQRILWRENASQDVKEYRLLTVTYGTSSAPFLAIRVLHQLAEDEQVNYPDVSHILKTDLYMDDLMTGASTEEEAAQLQTRLAEVFKAGCFPLHKWSSNSESLLHQFPSVSKVDQSEVNIKFSETVKALGIKWLPKSDTFELKIELCFESNAITKRNVLSSIAKAFDPLGWLAPLVIVLKIFMQKLWLAGLEWDEELSNELKAEWFTYLDNFNTIPSIQLQRWLNTSNNSKLELHGFSDASCSAYAGVVYLRVLDADKITVHLIISKTRVSPVKQVSLPRLELCGAVLVSKLLQFVKTSLKISDDNVFAWTDSTIVLAWLRKSPHTWNTFVANRTTEILNVMNSSMWHHVYSADNPADCASRGASPTELIQSELWWSGPAFLRENVTIHYHKFDEPEIVLEKKVKEKVTYLCLVDVDDTITYLNKYSNLTKLTRVTAYCLRFAYNCKSKVKNDKIELPAYLTVDELDKALNVCIVMSQTVYFGKELELFRSEKAIPKSSKIHVLNPYLDEKSVLRVGGRLVNAQIPLSTKSPIILSNKCNLAILIVRNAHEKTMHGGHQLTLNYLRRSYWILRAKQLVRKTIHSCIVCFKYRAQPTPPFMGNLPEYRINPSRPFKKSGVDYAGPFNLKSYPGRCNRITKAYIALFVCTSTKAIHLELVSDLSASAFIAAFRRFTSRRGHCSDLYSDCGTNFIGASRELQLAFQSTKSSIAKEIAELLSNDGTVWHFIPPSSPHFGGLWESGVKSVKGHIKRVIGQTSLTFEEFSTLLNQVEACVNSRPLTLIDSSENVQPLTPGHFLVGEPLVTVPQPDLTDTKITSLDRWNLLQKFMQTIWQRWQIEYLTTLQNRYKWSQHKSDIKLNSVVLVKDDHLPPGKWLLGRVIQLHPGADGVTRVVSLQYKNNVFKRPVTKLCPLPIDTADNV